MSHDVVKRCTRDGVTSWQNVAAQLGCSVESARKRFDPQYLPIRPWPHPCEEIAPEVVDENDTHSLAPKGPGMRMEVICLLHRLGHLSSADIANRLGKPVNSVRARLSQIKAEGWVENDGFGRANGLFEWTWKLTEAGRLVAVTGCAEAVKEPA